MPLFNNASSVEKSIKSLLRQSWTNLEIVVSDDGSSDSTLEICNALAKSDKRIKVFKQDRNLYYQNFLFVLEKAEGNFFMWAAGDDYWRPRYIESNLEVLLDHPDICGCISRCLFVRDGKPIGLAKGTYPLLNESTKNIEDYLRNPADNTRMYGLFRRDILLKSFPKRNFHAYDWALSATTLLYGKHEQLDAILMKRDKTPTENYSRSVNRDHRLFLFRYFPVSQMLLHLFLISRIPIRLGILRAAFRLNYIKHQEYLQIVRPDLYKRLSKLYLAFDRHILWRL